MKQNISLIINLYRKLFARKFFYRLNKGLYFLSLKGLGIGNWENNEVSGEKSFLRQFVNFGDEPTIIDVGANIGNYSDLIKTLSPSAVIYAFEPHPQTFAKLQTSALQNGYKAFNLACSDTIGKGKLYDHENDHTGTEHASLSKDAIEVVHSSKSVCWGIDLITLDSFVEQNSIKKISLLKIDVEGHEMKVLQGLNNTLNRGLVEIIHFEFTEINIVTRVFMKDFCDILHNYNFFRMLPDGLAPMNNYYAPLYEIYSYQNIVAVHKESSYQFK